MIKVSHLSKNYGDLEVLRDVSFEVSKGEIVGLLGQNGAGKTTLMRIITGYIPSTDGRAFIDGLDISEKGIEAKRLLGYLPENCPLYPEMRVEDFLLSMGSLHGLRGNNLRERLSYVLEAVKIEDRRRKIISTLSKGYKQRVGLASALIHDPKVLILDEPTIGLDPNQIIEIRDLIKNLRGDMTIILSSHILPEVSQTCDRIIIISSGNIVAEGKEDELVSNLPQNNKVYIKVSGKEDEVCDLVSGIEGVLAASVNGSNEVEVNVDIDKDIRSLLASKIVGGGFELLEMKKEELSLEKIFISLTGRQL